MGSSVTPPPTVITTLLWIRSGSMALAKIALKRKKKVEGKKNPSPEVKRKKKKRKESGARSVEAFQHLGQRRQAALQQEGTF